MTCAGQGQADLPLRCGPLEGDRPALRGVTLRAVGRAGKTLARHARDAAAGPLVRASRRRTWLGGANRCGRQPRRLSHAVLAGADELDEQAAQTLVDRVLALGMELD